MSKLGSFFKKLGGGMKKLFSLVATLATDQQISVAMGIVQQFAGQQIDNARRREAAVARVQSKLKVPESLARWLVETAVQALKKQANAELNKIEELLKADEDPSMQELAEQIEALQAQFNAKVAALQAAQAAEDAARVPVDNPESQG